MVALSLENSELAWSKVRNFHVHEIHPQAHLWAVPLSILGYDAMGYALSKPKLRAELEADLKRWVHGGLSTVFHSSFFSALMKRFQMCEGIKRSQRCLLRCWFIQQIV